MASVSLRGVVIDHGGGPDAGGPALDGVDLDIADGELVVLVGPSGAGKTSVLRAIAGLDHLTAGRVVIDGDDVTTADPGVRDAAMVFQVPRLLPNRTVGRNVAFPLEVRRLTAEEIRLRVSAEARALHIEALLDRAPDRLSAGEAQLVQVARALVRVPRVLLLDEPLARLDPMLRDTMRHELRALQGGYQVTTVLTTNDPIEAMSMADRLVVLDAGRIVQQGSPIDVYREPATLVAAHLTGTLRTGEVEVRADRQGYWLYGVGDAPERAWRPSLGAFVGRKVVRGVRDDGTRIYFDPATGGRLR